MEFDDFWDRYGSINGIDQIFHIQKKGPEDHKGIFPYYTNCTERHYYKNRKNRKGKIHGLFFGKLNKIHANKFGCIVFNAEAIPLLADFLRELPDR